ncbi:MAG: bifunctional UDP-N-acetylglucosamine diphosphorylase/glucosamine-1-phosphate N-acetyltransferase GlmU [Bryobacterales bacterium]|nr:bifunctional UDP-N-acetylglucosamine diphosphorylase/glucosamine-1-phosphate N-acetyltransferase GlmU [Bryobacteraceae bacterium]MDW8355863.1 bifunctional UDP-N-acetylglucosamine diphosphorylase/glucosamine-1-phosphate N-acetyltransferase GlmU [Bryobacterales bacterium]
MDDTAIVILAAGLGTRMKSRHAKVLHRAGGRALIEHVLEAVLEVVPPQQIVVVTGCQAEAVESLVRDRGVRFARQQEPRGTGHAVMAARDATAGAKRVAVLYGDCPLLTAETLRRLIAHQAASDAAAVLLTTFLDDPTGYGRILRDPDGRIVEIVEEKSATEEQRAIREINAGFYCFAAAALWEHIREIRPDNAAGEYYLTDLVKILRQAGKMVLPLPHDNSQELLGINTRAELAAADRILRERIARRLMLEGVTIEKPETVTIDPEVRIGMDTVIGPFAQILGRSVIGENCRVGACAILEDAQLEDDVAVEPFSVVRNARLERGAQVGPFARLRQHAHLAPGARVGNFVELKNTSLGAGARALHLAYLGDATVGQDVNIGAGTITCNFDGYTKHPTHIAARAFIGSNATLVAPVEIGEESYVGAGSVITDDVPPGALALGRARQVNKPGWVEKRKRERAAEKRRSESPL